MGKPKRGRSREPLKYRAGDPVSFEVFEHHAVVWALEMVQLAEAFADAPIFSSLTTGRQWELPTHNGRARSKTPRPRSHDLSRLGARARARDAKAELAANLFDPLPLLTSDTWHERPKTWGECLARDLPSTCPFVSCAHHLYLDVNGETVKLNFPHLLPHQLAVKCALSVADAHSGEESVDLYHTASAMNLTRQAARQIIRRVEDKVSGGLKEWRSW